MISIAETKSRGWFSKWFTKRIHYYSNGRALCKESLKLDTSFRRTEIKKVDTRPCKTCTRILTEYNDLDNFDKYHSE